MYSILVIENDDDYRELLELGLTNKGHQVQVVSGAKIALTLTAKVKFDIIICDVLMPEMDGIEFLLEVKKENLASKIIMISGGGVSKSNLYLENSSAIGCDAILEKPFTITELDSLMQSII